MGNFSQPLKYNEVKNYSAFVENVSPHFVCSASVQLMCMYVCGEGRGTEINGHVWSKNAIFKNFIADLPYLVLSTKKPCNLQYVAFVASHSNLFKTITVIVSFFFQSRNHLSKYLKYMEDLYTIHPWNI